MQAVKDILQGVSPSPSVDPNPWNLTGGLAPIYQVPTFKPKLELKSAPSVKYTVIKYIPGPGQIPVYTWSSQSAQEKMAGIQTFPSLEILEYTDNDYSQLLVDPSVYSRFL
jgi:hypothetical protein